MAGNCGICLAVTNLTSSWGLEKFQYNMYGNFSSAYSIGRTLGRGQFGTVKQCTRKDDGNTKYAVKCIDKSNLSLKDEESIREEIQILEYLDHPNVIRLFDSYDETNYHYIVTELMEGGELFDRIVSKTTYSEKETRDVCKIVFEAIRYCHDLNICHRDLKPENLLLFSEHDDSHHIKIADFGLARRVSPNNPNCLRTKCGTPEYAAPDVFCGKTYGVKSDMWSMGVIIFILLSGYPPFTEQSTSKLLLKIRSAKYTFDDEYWCNVSDGAKDLVSKLLVVDPQKRLSANDALNHKWMLKSDASLAKLDLGDNFENLKKFNANRKFRATARAVIMSNKLKINAILRKEKSAHDAISKQ